MNPHPPADWLEFWVRFVCGAIFGAVVDLGTMIDAPHPWLVLAAFCLVFGIIAGWFGDRFWELLRFW
jgi:hypothetical protein